jgi:hypothetical protein
VHAPRTCDSYGNGTIAARDLPRDGERRQMHPTEAIRTRAPSAGSPAGLVQTIPDLPHSTLIPGNVPTTRGRRWPQSLR